MNKPGHQRSWFHETGLADHHCSPQKENMNLTTKVQHQLPLLAGAAVDGH